MLSAGDKAAITAALADVRSDRSESIVIRRGDNTLAAQTVRIERIRAGRLMASDRGSERRADVVVHGAIALDIAVEDRFNDSAGQLYRVAFIRPNRSVATFAEAVLVE